MIERYTRNWSGGKIESLRVPVLTIGNLIDRHAHILPVMLLQIDTEGHDFEVVKSAIQANCLPKVIHYEHQHLSIHDQLACRNLLGEKDYSFAANGHNTIAYNLGC
jgi:hypothetical protein